MVICRSACWPLVVIILFATFAAVAQTNSPAGAGGGKFRATCGEDLQQFCAGVQPGGGRLVQCLSSHTSELSAACGNLISAAGRSGAKLRAACDQDLQQFCVGVQPGGGRLVQCLSSHANELSAACGNMISAAGRSGAKLRTACDQDLQQFCAGVQPGGGRLAQCLSSHANELSAACGNMISAAGRGGAKLRAVCDQDLQQFCVGVQPGRRPLVQCLSSHTGHLSAACRNMITAIHLKGSSNSSAESPAPQPAAPVTTGNSPATIGSILRASCGPDVERLCSEARRESDVLKCLDSQRMELSTSCSLYFQNLGARPTAQQGAPNKKPPSPLPTTPIPAQESAPNKNPPSPLPTTPIPAQESAPNKKSPSPPPTTPMPFPD